jgi:hypothetical protein
MTDPRTQIQQLKEKLADLSEDLASLEKLLGVDVPSSLNKIRFITEKVLHTMCIRRGVTWGEAEPTLERMIGPLTSEGVIPKNIATLVRTIQTNTSPGSHYQEHALSQTHVTIAQTALIEFLEWYFSAFEGGPAGEARFGQGLLCRVTCLAAEACGMVRGHGNSGGSNGCCSDLA